MSKNITNISLEIKDFFNDIMKKSPKEIKKIKNKAMSRNVHLKSLRKKFCKYCLTPYDGTEKIRIKKGNKKVLCRKCGKENKWVVKKKL
jgi:RNase P subunit RPR2